MSLGLVVALAAFHPHPPPPVEPARARANLASYVSRADYPASALRAREQGEVGFTLAVGADAG